jgi:hypothetical protein
LSKSFLQDYTTYELKYMRHDGDILGGALAPQITVGEFKRGVSPSFLTNSPSPSKESDEKGESKRGLCPLFMKNLPLPLNKGKGIKGIGFIRIRG